MHTHDILGRRLRITPVSTGKRVTLSDRDFTWLQAIHDHGPLSSRTLYAFTNGNLAATLRRLKELVNEKNTTHGASYLIRPFSQNDTFNARSNYLVYDLSPAAEDALRERGTWSDNRPSGRNPWKHACMSAAITSAIAIGCQKHSLRFIPQHELLDRAGKAIDTEVPYTWNEQPRSGVLFPDGLFAIDYGGKFRAFVVEADRSTEPGEPTTDQRKSLKKNILQYRNFIGSKLYKDAYGLQSGLVALNVFVSERRKAEFLRIVHDQIDHSSYLWAMSIPQFASPFRPTDVVHELYREPWERAGHEPASVLEP